MINSPGNSPAECQWIGTAAEYPRLQPTCCQPAVAGRSYCLEHVWLVYQQGTALGRRQRDASRADSVHQWTSLFNEAVEELENEGFL